MDNDSDSKSRSDVGGSTSTGQGGGMTVGECENMIQRSLRSKFPIKFSVIYELHNSRVIRLITTFLFIYRSSHGEVSEGAVGEIWMQYP